MSTTNPTDPLAAAMGPSGSFVPPTPEELAPHLPHLEIQALIGQGGMGAVYRAKRHADSKLLALKVVRPEVGKEATFAARFAREAEVLERLRHPHIVAIHGHGQAGPWCWLLMDLIAGANLREIVATGRLSSAQTLALVPPLCAALQYAHDHGVVHRDLKPENILLDSDGVPHLVDFGLAKLRDSTVGSDLTHTGAGMGTLHYMAPEQVADAKSVDHRADIYALGVVIYELLTGQLPLGRFEVPSQRVQVDVRIDEVVLKALERDPQRRWQQVGQVAQAVRVVQDGAPTAVAEPAALPTAAAGELMALRSALFFMLGGLAGAFTAMALGLHRGVALGLLGAAALGLAATLGVSAHLGWRDVLARGGPARGGFWRWALTPPDQWWMFSYLIAAMMVIIHSSDNGIHGFAAQAAMVFGMVITADHVMRVRRHLTWADWRRSLLLAGLIAGAVVLFAPRVVQSSHAGQHAAAHSLLYVDGTAPSTLLENMVLNLGRQMRDDLSLRKEVERIGGPLGIDHRLTTEGVDEIDLAILRSTLPRLPAQAADILRAESGINADYQLQVRVVKSSQRRNAGITYRLLAQVRRVLDGRVLFGVPEMTGNVHTTASPENAEAEF